jgi:hypothetical protein
VDTTCGHDTYDIQDFQPGYTITYLVCFLLAVITLAMTLVIWKRYWYRTLDLIKTSHKQTFNDMIVIMIVVIDFCQYAAMGPSFRSFISFLHYLSQITAVNLTYVVELEGGGFWIVLEVLFGVCVLYFLLCVLIFFKCDVKYHMIDFCWTLGYIGENMLPIITNTFFLPIIHLITEVFV